LLAVTGQEDAEAIPPQVQIDEVGYVRVVFNDHHRAGLSIHAP
jgi:hypothetical protein